MRPSGRTRVFALLGDPVSHSLSPVMQNAAFRVLGLDAVYVPLRCSAADVAGLMRALACAGGGGNVTVPHKRQAAASVDRLTEGAEGSCNTFWAEEETLVGTSTDPAGILGGLAAISAPASSWLIIGTGGSAWAAVDAAIKAGASVAVRSRSPERAAALLARATAAGARSAPIEACDVAINATPLGLADGDPFPLDPPGAIRFGLDLVYRRGMTPWVRALRAAGCQAADGREVLVAQGAAAVERWFPGVRAPTEVMRATVAAALR
ncbi:MAG TPA: shikimate dehydrogenase [Gemmatimonadales bacterium]